jgi:hypothetical protein
MTIRWEYKIAAFNGARVPTPGTKPIAETMLDQLGEEGWELVSILPVDLEGTPNPDTVVFYLKRPKTD